MNRDELYLYDFLQSIDHDALAETFKGVVTTTPISNTALCSVTEDILTVFYARLVRAVKPRSMSIMEFDTGVVIAQGALHKPEHPSSLPAWLRIIKASYIDFYTITLGKYKNGL